MTRATPEDFRETVLLQWPDLFKKGRDMVIGSDLDALLFPAAFLHHRYGWQVVGFYDLDCVHLAEGVTWEQARAACWVDLDIAQADITSIGHHILTWKNPSRGKTKRPAHKKSEPQHPARHRQKHLWAQIPAFHYFPVALAHKRSHHTKPQQSVPALGGGFVAQKYV